MHLSGQTLRKVTKISTVPDRWSRCLCGLVEVYSPSPSQRSDSPSYHPVACDQAAIPAESSGVAHRDRSYQTALTSEPLNLIPAVGDWKGAIPSSVVDCTSRVTQRQNDSGRVCGELTDSGFPIKATCVQPHQTIAARGRSRSTCLLFAEPPSTEYCDLIGAYPISPVALLGIRLPSRPSFYFLLFFSFFYMHVRIIIIK